ncbi:MAG: hypothetical protein IT374_03110 [Polyangiaceae bacterium]|nr:hypothetical protein [Polyangiaceae bacterium]
MAKNRIFFPQLAFDVWLSDGHVELRGDELTMKDEGRSYRISEAVRVLGEVTGTPDPHELVGRVKSRGYLQELGAEIVEGSMIIGDNAYDVVVGFSGVPVGSYEEHVAEQSRRDRDSLLPATDEDLLGQFLSRVL